MKGAKIKASPTAMASRRAMRSILKMMGRDLNALVRITV